MNFWTTVFKYDTVEKKVLSLNQPLTMVKAIEGVIANISTTLRISTVAGIS